MNCYYCIVSTTEDPIADVCVLDALDDEAALARGREAAGAVVGWRRVAVYEGERLVGRVERGAETRALPLAA